MFNQYEFAKRLKELREKEGLNQTKLARKLNVSRGSISYYENAERMPDIETLYQMATLLEVSADYLIGRSDVKKIDPNMSMICECTNLSEKAVKHLQLVPEPYCKILNYLLEDWALPNLIGQIAVLLSAKSVLGFFKDKKIISQDQKEEYLEAVENVDFEEFRLQRELLKMCDRFFERKEKEDGY